MSTISFPLYVSYSQIVIFDSTLADPFNFWTKKHSDQGFAWRPECVSFATLEAAAYYDIEVVLNPENDRLSPEATRIIQTPFEVPPGGMLVVASVYDKTIVKISPGRYNLRYECFPITTGGKGRLRLIFTESEHTSFAILRADAELSIVGELLLTAEPA
jgi:hypothetical protein